MAMSRLGFHLNLSLSTRRMLSGNRENNNLRVASTATHCIRPPSYCRRKSQTASLSTKKNTLLEIIFENARRGARAGNVALDFCENN